MQHIGFRGLGLAPAMVVGLVFFWDSGLRFCGLIRRNLERTFSRVFRPLRWDRLWKTIICLEVTTRNPKPQIPTRVIEFKG